MRSTETVPRRRKVDPDRLRVDIARQGGAECVFSFLFAVLRLACVYVCVWSRSSHKARGTRADTSLESTTCAHARVQREPGPRASIWRQSICGQLIPVTGHVRVTFSLGRLANRTHLLWSVRDWHAWGGCQRRRAPRSSVLDWPRPARSRARARATLR
jgi:hypothetical protein